MKITTLFESASSDGYTTTGDGKYFSDFNDADDHAYLKHGGHGRVLTHNSIGIIDDEYYALVSTTPIVLYGSDKYDKLIRKTALEKLTVEDRKVLGLL